jgi:hypothetical protein
MMAQDFIAMLAEDFSWGLRAADARQPVATSQRRKEVSYKAGIGPHSETRTIELVLDELREWKSSIYGSAKTNVPYPNLSLQKCDLVLDTPDTWFVEAKMMRLMGDNGKPNDNILTHILSPYPRQNSALTDCEKLSKSGFPGRYAILIFGYEYPSWPLAPVMSAFECLARRNVSLSAPAVAIFENLIHPVHVGGAVYAWEVSHASG